MFEFIVLVEATNLKNPNDRNYINLLKCVTNTVLTYQLINPKENKF